MRYDPSNSILAGMDTAVLQASLARLQQAYIDLSTGAKGESYTYTQGDGSKAITYSRANIGQLTMAIRQIQAQLGIIDRPRRAIGVRFT
jgi:hypothetical protein